MRRVGLRSFLAPPFAAASFEPLVAEQDCATSDLLPSYFRPAMRTNYNASQFVFLPWGAASGAFAWTTFGAQRILPPSEFAAGRLDPFHLTLLLELFIFPSLKNNKKRERGSSGPVDGPVL